MQAAFRSLLLPHNCQEKGAFDSRSKEIRNSGSFKGDVANIEIHIQVLQSDQVAPVPDDKYTPPK